MKFSISKTLQLYKDSYSGHPREIWNLVIVTLINRMGTMVLPFLSVYFTTELCFTMFEAGLLAGAFGVGSFVGTWIGGKLMDRFNARIVILMIFVLVNRQKLRKTFVMRIRRQGLRVCGESPEGFGFCNAGLL